MDLCMAYVCTVSVRFSLIFGLVWFGLLGLLSTCGLASGGGTASIGEILFYSYFFSRW